jgi:hypothetical protein
MKELIRANDPVLLSWVIATLSGENIESVVLDTHTSVLEGSVTAIERRVMVIDEDYSRARRILDDARDDGFDV